MQIRNERDFLIRRWSDLAELDWLIIIPIASLFVFSLFLLKSAASGQYFSKQLFFLIPSFILGFLALNTRIRSLEDNATWIYILNILLLVFVLVKGSIAMGSQRWISLGPLNFQPSELAKLAIIISLAAWFSKFPIKNFLGILISGIIILPPFFLIFKQPDLGTSLTYIAIFLGMAYWAGATLTHLLIVISPAVCLIMNATGDIIYSFGVFNFHGKVLDIAITNNFLYFLLFLFVWLFIDYKPWKSPWIVLAISGILSSNFFIGLARPLLWNFLHEYQQRRLTIFLNPESDPLGAGYHIVQSLLAIGNGGFWGYGFLNGRLTKGNYVPAQHTDFIFSIAGEEFGFIGASFIVLMFILLLLRILFIALTTQSRFSSFICIGIFSFFLFHILVNIGMTIGIMPITGVPLPFLSYGGSALLVDFFAIAILISISWRTLPHRFF